MDSVAIPNISALISAGLTDSQARGYLALIRHGTLTPVELAKQTGESRTNGYMICEKLESLGLAKKQDGTRTAYRPENPTKLRQLLLSRQKELKQANEALSGVLPQLLSTYRLVTDKPGVLHLEGVDSLFAIYDDIIQTGDTVRIFPCAHDRDDPVISDAIDQQIERQRRAGIKTETLMRPHIIQAMNIQNDELFEARPCSMPPLDAQLLIYGTNVAITTFNTGVVTTIITNPQIADTLRVIFSLLWDPRSTTNATSAWL